MSVVSEFKTAYILHVLQTRLSSERIKTLFFPVLVIFYTKISTYDFVPSTSDVPVYKTVFNIEFILAYILANSLFGGDVNKIF